MWTEYVKQGAARNNNKIWDGSSLKSPNSKWIVWRNEAKEENTSIHSAHERTTNEKKNTKKHTHLPWYQITIIYGNSLPTSITPVVVVLFSSVRLSVCVWACVRVCQHIVRSVLDRAAYPIPHSKHSIQIIHKILYVLVTRVGHTYSCATYFILYVSRTPAHVQRAVVLARKQSPQRLNCVAWKNALVARPPMPPFMHRQQRVKARNQQKWREKPERRQQRQRQQYTMNM